ncbi:conserved Plasmodium protein, unknown function [Plasmodium ovale curtisi]|uniref:Uncharacterized protein n=1 Tax=Plasmodium ovale curtisi TaxID=864141 RepID=A0A1A8WTJ5_PLAOA|nr:conserved Plasmodium protein, unknown function [Plasmodium ovale curtisi]
MFKSIVPATVGLNNSKYVHANIDEEFNPYNVHENGEGNNLGGGSGLSCEHIIRASEVYNINVESLEKCRTPEEVALKILKSHSLKNKRKYTDDSDMYYEKKKKCCNTSSELVYFPNDHSVGRNSPTNQNIMQKKNNTHIDAHFQHNMNNKYKRYSDNNVTNSYSFALGQGCKNSSTHFMKNVYEDRQRLLNSFYNYRNNSYGDFSTYSTNQQRGTYDGNSYIDHKTIKEINLIKLSYKHEFYNKCNFNKRPISFAWDGKENRDLFNGGPLLERGNIINGENCEGEGAHRNGYDQHDGHGKRDGYGQRDEHGKSDEYGQRDKHGKSDEYGQRDEHGQQNGHQNVINNQGMTLEQTMHGTDETECEKPLVHSVKKESVEEEDISELKSEKEEKNETKMESNEQPQQSKVDSDKVDEYIFERRSSNMESSCEEKVTLVTSREEENTQDECKVNKKMCTIFEENIESFLKLSLNDINKNMKIKKIISCVEKCLKLVKNINFEKKGKMKMVIDRLFSNAKECLKKEITYRKGERKKMTCSSSSPDEIQDDEKYIDMQYDDECGDYNTPHVASTYPILQYQKKGKKNTILRKGSNNIINDIIYGHYNILLYLILTKFIFFKKYINTEELNENVLIHLKKNFQNVTLKLSLSEIKNKVIQFYNIHESYLIQLTSIYEKCLLYMYDLYTYIEKYETVLVNLIDLCLLPFHIHYNVQRVIVNSINLLLKVFSNHSRSSMKKYIVDHLVLNINNVNFKYNKITFKNSLVNSTYIHLFTFVLLKIAETFSSYNGDFKAKFLQHQRRRGHVNSVRCAVCNGKRRKAGERSNCGCDGDGSDSDCDSDNEKYSIREGYTERGKKKELSFQSDESFDLSLFTSENESDNNSVINEHSGDGKVIRKYCTKRDHKSGISKGVPNDRNKNHRKQNRKYLLRTKRKMKSDIYEYDNFNTTGEGSNSEICIGREKKWTHANKHSNFAKKSLPNSSIDVGENNYQSEKGMDISGESISNELINNITLRKNFKRLNNVVNYILIEMIEKVLYEDNRNAKNILQFFVLDLIKCCDNPIFSVSTLFIKNIIHLFFDIINEKQEGNVKETCIYILRYIFIYIFNIYNYVNNSCFHLLYNFNKELHTNKFIKPFFQMSNDLKKSEQKNTQDNDINLKIRNSNIIDEQNTQCEGEGGEKKKKKKKKIQRRKNNPFY